MKKYLLFTPLLFVVLLSPGVHAQEAVRQHDNAKDFMRQGDYTNAILMLNRLLQSDPRNKEVAKDLSLSYYFSKDYNKALQIINPLLDKEDADDQSFQIAGNIYQTSGMFKEAERCYRRGLKKFPRSGPLYNDLGEMLLAQKDYDAVKEWEKGIEVDPTFGKNYYNAAKYYFLTIDKVWSIIYGEAFVNMEPIGSRTPEIKALLIESYKKLFADVDLEQNNKDKNGFVKAFLQTMNKQTSVALQGINAETLTMIRTRFILDWNNTYSTKYPFYTYQYHTKLLQEGLFDAYNQWIFGSSQNLAGFQYWINTHSAEYTAFTNFQRTTGFKTNRLNYFH